jgi:hypothetical protein
MAMYGPEYKYIIEVRPHELTPSAFGVAENLFHLCAILKLPTTADLMRWL